LCRTADQSRRKYSVLTTILDILKIVVIAPLSNLDKLKHNTNYGHRTDEPISLQMERILREPEIYFKLGKNIINGAVLRQACTNIFMKLNPLGDSVY
jgi:hypothetical protein